MGSIYSFGAWVKQQRKKLGLTQAELATCVGSALVTIKKIEQDLRRPSRQLAVLLAEQLHIPITDQDRFVAVARGLQPWPADPQAETIPVRATSGGDAQSTTSNPRFFVGRDRELAWLDAHLNSALASRGRIAFVSGEAGRGKSSLLIAFAQRAQARHPDLVVAGGSCNAFAGTGDPFLPFREALLALTGDIDARWAGAISSQQRARLWHLLPYTVQTLVEHGPDLINVLMAGAPLLHQVTAHFGADGAWQRKLQDIVQQRAQFRNTEQQQIFEQVRHVLDALARRSPLLLLVDDLQWADNASLNLLFHLGQRIASSPLLILGAFRASEVTGGEAHGMPRYPHPLWTVVTELKRHLGEIELDLEETRDEEGCAFVDALLDMEANQLGPPFRTGLFQRTRGYPLFTVELLQAMQDRGDLIRNKAGHWVEGSSLDWNALPTRVEAAIAQRVGRLPAQLQRLLKIASVEGEVFSAEVVAGVLNCNSPEVISQLSHALGRQAQLVQTQGSRRLASQRISQYRFRHALFQYYLYHQLDAVERCTLHEAVGNTLERLYEIDRTEIAPQLARHFEEANVVEKAISYLILAGKRAVQLSANMEAIVHLKRALDLLQTRPPSLERDQQELEVHTVLGVPLVITLHYADPEVEETYERAYWLCLRLGQRLLPSILRFLAGAAIVRGNYLQTQEWATKLLALAEQDENPMYMMEAHYLLGVNYFWLGEFVRSRQHLEQALALYDPRQQQMHLALFAQDPRVVCLQRLAYTLWYLGYPDQAVTTANEALHWAKELAHPFSLAYALTFASWFYLDCRHVARARDLVESVIDFSQEHGLPHWEVIGKIFQGWLMVEQGESGVGLDQMRGALTTYQATGRELGWPFFQGLLARAYQKLGSVQAGLAVLDEALQTANRHSDHWHDAELCRLRGELLLHLDSPGSEAVTQQEAEACFHWAMIIAQRLQSKSLELRASMSLSRLWSNQGKQQEAWQVLEQAYSWFTEGFDTPDLKDAKAWLETLSKVVVR